MQTVAVTLVLYLPASQFLQVVSLYSPGRHVGVEPEHADCSLFVFIPGHSMQVADPSADAEPSKHCKQSLT